MEHNIDHAFVRALPLNVDVDADVELDEFLNVDEDECLELDVNEMLDRDVDELVDAVLDVEFEELMDLGVDELLNEILNVDVDVQLRTELSDLISYCHDSCVRRREEPAFFLEYQAGKNAGLFSTNFHEEDLNIVHIDSPLPSSGSNDRSGSSIPRILPENKMDSCDAVERELDKVTAKFGNVCKDSIDRLDEIIEKLKSVQNRWRIYGRGFLDHGDPWFKPDYNIIQECLEKIPDCVGKIATDHREQHSTVSKVGKAIDRNFTPDFGSITRDGLFSGERDKILTQVICQHLYRIGMLDIGDNLCEESGLCLDAKYKEPFVELHRILEALKARELEPALKWAAENRQALLQQGSSLEFKLHRMAFINILKLKPDNQNEAITYARANFAPFVKRHEKEIQVLMGALLYTNKGRNKYDSPYSHVFGTNHWEDIQDTFTRDACARLGLSIDSPLAVCFSAGCVALPALLNISQVMQARQVANIWSGKDELPIEIDLGKYFHYHSVFACPILRQQASESNPPMRLTCGHVISRDALHKLASGNKLKCPYCPGEQNPNEARQITF